MIFLLKNYPHRSDKSLMELYRNKQISEELPSSFWKCESLEEIKNFLTDSFSNELFITCWILKDGKKHIKGGVIDHFDLENGLITFSPDPGQTFEAFKGHTSIYLYVPGKKRNILFKTFIKNSNLSTINVMIPSSLYVHDLRTEKRIYVSRGKNIEVLIGYAKNEEMVHRSCRMLDLSSNSIGLFLELSGIPSFSSGDIITIKEIPIENLKVPFKVEVRYIHQEKLHLDSRTTLKGYRIGCKFVGQKLNIKKK